MNDISKELIQNTIEVWSPEAGYTISEEEAIEIIQNIRNYVRVLMEIDQNHKANIQIDFNDINNLKTEGFSGFKSVKELWEDKSCIPKIKGVYLVLDHNGTADFINPGVGGFFKGKDPNISIEELNNNYVKDSLVVYIGKAGSPTGKATLHSRLNQYLRFGQGKNVGHWGGRLIWQLKNYRNLVFCWKLTIDDDPREVEKQLIDNYEKQYGMKPFANLVR